MPGALTAARAESLTVRLLQAETAAWDAFVAGTNGGTFCHLAGWREIMSEVMGLRCEYLVAEDAWGHWQGVLPLVEMRSGLLGRYLLSMPYLNDGGPLGTLGARRSLAHEAVARARRWGAKLLEMRARERVPGDLVASNRRVAVHLPLPERAEELWEKGIRAKLRSQIRRPQKAGLTCRFGLDQVEPFYEVFARNMRDLGTPVHPRAFFERIARVLAEQAHFGVVYKGDVPVAAGCGFLWGGEFEITWASSLREHSSDAPNMLLYWSFMEEVIGRGARLFNFGRCAPGGGTHRFKLQWGGYDVALPWAQWSAGQADGPPSAEGRLFRLATHAWQRLPMGIANTLGPVLARKLPHY
jgi:serine/alanine adding enzyme